MAYWITRFGETAIPGGQIVQDTGLPIIHSPPQATASGRSIDPYGAGIAPVQLPYSLHVRCMVRAETPAAASAAFYALRALHGRRDLLYRTPTGGAANSQFTLARLVAITAERSISDVHTLPILLEFAVLSAPWSGSIKTVTQALDTIPKVLTCVNDGNARVDNAILRVTAAGSAITETRITVTGVSEIRWIGTLGVGSTLTIDCSAGTVRIGTANAFAGFSLLAGHTVSEWLRLAPGATNVSIHRTGGSVASTASIEYRDGWA